MPVSDADSRERGAPSPHEATIVGLAARAVSGDRLACDILVGALQPGLVWYARCIASELGSTGATAEDAAHDVIETIYASIHSLRNPDAVVAWAYQIARRRVRYLVSQERRLGLVAPLELFEFDERRQARAPGLDLESLLDLRIILEDIARLPDGERHVTVLRILLDLEVDETARRLGISPGTAKSQLSRARVVLRKRIQSRSARLPVRR